MLELQITLEIKPCYFTDEVIMFMCSTAPETFLFLSTLTQ